MHLRHLLIRDCKLMRQLEVSFLHDDGSPRLWTVFVGENGTCKTTLLRSIAITAVGSAFANHLVSDPKAYVDRRGDHSEALIKAGFGFFPGRHGAQTSPYVAPEVVAFAKVSGTAVDVRGLSSSWETSADAMDALEASVNLVTLKWLQQAAKAANAAAAAATEGSLLVAKELAAKAKEAADMFESSSQIRISNPFDEASRDQFIAGYGVGRVLTVPTSTPEGGVAARDRVKSLFDADFRPEGTSFSDRLARSFGEQRAHDFTRYLQTALIERMHTPRLRDIELRRQGSAKDQLEPVESHQAGILVGGSELKLPAVWLSQGYQAVISLVADIIGNVWLEAGKPVELDDMEGIVLVDELDLHLHPTWQTEIVTGLKATFPKMQFIVTTHSPLVLAGCRAEEVWTLAQDKATGDVTARQGNVAPMLLTTSEMYREYFGVSRTYASELGEALRRYVELASNPFRSDAEDEQVAALHRHLLDNRVDVDYQPVARKTVS